MIRKTIAAASLVAAFAAYGTAFASADKVLLCHHTGSQSNPFVLINVSTNSLAGHAQTDDFPAPGTTVESCADGEPTPN